MKVKLKRIDRNREWQAKKNRTLKGVEFINLANGETIGVGLLPEKLTRYIQAETKGEKIIFS